jgi:hypothetical protein
VAWISAARSKKQNVSITRRTDLMSAYSLRT